MHKFIACILVFLTAAGCSQHEKAPDPEAYKKDISHWKTERLENLKSRDGWLNLAGLYFLKEGENSFGADSSNDIIFPEGAPAFAGTIIKSGDVIRLSPAENANVTIKDKIVDRITDLKTDLSGHPTEMESGSFAWFVIRRGDQYGIRLRNYQHPRLDELSNIPSYPVNLEWRVQASFIPFKHDTIFKIATMIGGTEDYKCPGKLIFKVDTSKVVIYPFESGNNFFILFGDGTSAHETYAAGRFLYTKKPDRQNMVIIDFNKAYNPPCAFSPFATCPLPPPENRLKVAIRAGEKAVHLD